MARVIIIPINPVEWIMKTINPQIEKAEKDFKLIKSAYTNNATNGTDDTSPTFKGFEEGSSGEGLGELVVKVEEQIN